MKQHNSGILSTIILLLLLVAATSGVSLAENETELSNHQFKLQRLHKSIEKIQYYLKSTRHKRGHVITQLQKLETSIGKNARILKTTSKKVRQLDQRINKLKHELRQLNIQLRQQQSVLAEQVRAAYALGAQQQLKMLLNQQDASSLGRLQVYFDYLNRSRKRQITDFRDTIRNKQILETELNTAFANQQANLKKQKTQKNQLEKQRYKRNKLLVTLDLDIKNQEQTLTDLEFSRGRIENLLKSLGELLADIPPGPDNKTSFKARKGTLPWPVSGHFLTRFGQSKNQGGLKWNGVLISSQYGTPVTAISHGRVAFADWLQGFGFITIIDHGNGYMSLYGHNESLFKQAGDWVEANEVIATVGDSGGHSIPGLYFEIRERGKPVNPKQWCSHG